ncbi:hypothetical protein AcW1_002303 [Taiwanofungus camphoratus]|nr:hypothetical protein AcW1_002303 [Antrodia cinnamomea]
MAKNAENLREHACCGVVEEAVTSSRQKRARRRQKPIPWIVLKLAIAITVGIIAYAFYVYIGRFCVPLIRKNEGPLGRRSLGIGFLVVFCMFGIMMLWAYIKVVFTPPGLAKEYARKSPQPTAQHPLPSWWDPERAIAGTAYEYIPSPHERPEVDGHPNSQDNDYTEAPRESTRGSSANAARQQPQGIENAGMTDAIAPVAAARVARPSGPASHSMDNRNINISRPQPMMYTRKPPSTPALLPEYRYCERDGFIKPLRAHHCRACGACILRYDHHCPWIGQCVGAHNHKFFVIFLEWAILFCLWTFATLLAEVARDGSRNDSVDPQEIVIIALSALFFFFTCGMLLSHVYLLVHNQTTVESLGAHMMKERENRVLARMHAWYQFSARRRTRRLWDDEWGKIGTEGNIWWLGSYRRNWESVMGHHIWEWFLPIGRSPLDGLNYPTNPRFDAEGRWRPRREWPPELR